jgi:hypothetical protein
MTFLTELILHEEEHHDEDHDEDHHEEDIMKKILDI